MGKMLSVEEALDKVLGSVSLTSVETIPLIDALGRVLAEDVRSDIDISPFDNTGMDGFAVRYEDLKDASPENPVTLEVTGHIGAGSVFGETVKNGQIVRIMTGALVPPSTDTVVKVEDVTVAEGDGGVGSKITFTKTPKFGEHIRPKGEEAKAGQIVMKAGESVDAAGIGLLASTGNKSIPVRRRPRVGIIAIGSELVECDEVPGPGMIRNSNNYALGAAALDANAIAVFYPTVPDDEDMLREAIDNAARECDFVVTSGGASDGDFDFITPVVKKLGELVFNTVSMRPGKAQTFGIVNGTPVFGLPGNPAAAAVGFEIFIRPALRKMQGFSKLQRPITIATLGSSIKKRQERRYFLRGRVKRLEDGTYAADVSGNQSSALFGVLHRSNCLIILPDGLAPGVAGQKVECMRLDMEEGTL